MRHLNKGRTLNRKPAHRKAMLINLAVSILDKERVYTTLAKAKEVRGVVEGLITLGKRGGLHAIRQAARAVHDKAIIAKLFGDLAAEYKNREGGYTRIVKYGIRKGDAAMVAIIELVGRPLKSAVIPVDSVGKKEAGKPVEVKTGSVDNHSELEKPKKTKKALSKKEDSVKEKTKASPKKKSKE